MLRCFKVDETELMDALSFATVLLFPLLYIFPLYIVSKGRSRNDVACIRNRLITGILWVPIFSWVPTYCVLRSKLRQASGVSPQQQTFPPEFLPQYVIKSSEYKLDGNVWGVLRLLMGLRLNGMLVNGFLIPTMVVLTLFLGPAVAMVLETGVLNAIIHRNMMASIRDLIVAPWTEELCFRAGLISYMAITDHPDWYILWFSPMVFGFSHVHHMYDLVYHKKLHINSAFFVLLVQFAYTTLFGWFAALIFLKSGSIMAVTVAHAWCNLFGFPRFSDILYYKYRKVVIFAYISGIAAFPFVLRTWYIL